MFHFICRYSRLKWAMGGYLKIKCSQLCATTWNLCMTSFRPRSNLFCILKWKKLPHGRSHLLLDTLLSCCRCWALHGWSGRCWIEVLKQSLEWAACIRELICWNNNIYSIFANIEPIPNILSRQPTPLNFPLLHPAVADCALLQNHSAYCNIMAPCLNITASYCIILHWGWMILGIPGMMLTDSHLIASVSLSSSLNTI